MFELHDYGPDGQRVHTGFAAGSSGTLAGGKVCFEKVKGVNYGQHCRVIWGKICQSSDDYQAPRGEDNTILMNLFARTPEAMDRQSTALYQIAGRGRDAPEAFEEYQKGKDVDTALLAGCYKDPNVFIASDFLSKIMRDYTDDVRHDKFPLTARYLASFMG